LTAPPGRWPRGRERMVEICNDVVDVFYSDAQSEHLRTHAGTFALAH
jgi:hypothetical protein